MVMALLVCDLVGHKRPLHEELGEPTLPSNI